MKKLALALLLVAGTAQAEVALLQCKGKESDDRVREFTIEIGSTTVGVTEVTDGLEIRSANWNIEFEVFKGMRLMLHECSGKGCPDVGREDRVTLGRLDFLNGRSVFAVPSGGWLDVHLYDGSVKAESEADWNSSFPPEFVDWPRTRNDIEIACRKI